MPRIAYLLLPAALALLAGSPAGAFEGVQPAFRGEWVPPAAACGNAPLKVVIEANAVVFVNGSQRAEYRKLDSCGACMGKDVSNMTLLSTDAMGDSPFMITLDGRKKNQPGLSVDFSNDKKLGARFPLGTKGLKKCA